VSTPSADGSLVAARLNTPVCWGVLRRNSPGTGYLALAAAHHERCLADPDLNHPFSHPGQHPQHVARLGWYWAEVLGGPPRYTEQGVVQTSLARLHAHNGDLGDLPQRFVRCFVAAMDDVGLPRDAEFRAAMTAYME
jgi:hemoglobin